MGQDRSGNPLPAHHAKDQQGTKAPGIFLYLRWSGTFWVNLAWSPVDPKVQQ